MRTLAALLVLAVGGATIQAQILPPGQGAVGTTLNVATLNTGNVLHVSGTVSPDGRYVTTAVNPQFSALDGIDTFVVPNLQNGGGVGGGVGGGGVGGIGLGGGGRVGANGLGLATEVRRIAFRPAVVGRVIFVDNDKPLLAKAIAGGEWKGISFKDAAKKLADASKGNVVLGIRGFEQAGVDVNKQHNFKFETGTVKGAVLALIQTAAPETDIVVTAEDKVIQIATQAQADNVMVTKTYYLEDLLANIPRFVQGGTDLSKIGPGGKADPKVQENVEYLSSEPMDFSKAPTYAYKPAPKPEPKKVAPKPSGSTNILEVITSTVRPEIWQNNGGKAEMALVGNRVTIRAPQSVHAILEGPSHYNPNKVDSYINYGGG